MHWIDMMSYKGQACAKKPVDFISKKDVPVYFEQHSCIGRVMGQMVNVPAQGIIT